MAQVGKSFRNEISPKMGLIRQREFLMAEIEHFIDPTEKYSNYDKFNKHLQNCEVNLLSSEAQSSAQTVKPVKIKLKDAINLV